MYICTCAGREGQEEDEMEEEEEEALDVLSKPPSQIHSLLREVDELRQPGLVDSFGIRVSLAREETEAPITQQDTAPGLAKKLLCDYPSCHRELCADSCGGRTIKESTRAGSKYGRNWRPFWGMTVCSR